MTKRSDRVRRAHWCAGWRAGLGVLGLAAGLSGGAPANAEELVSPETKQTAEQGGMGAAAGLTSVVYAPVKVAYAAGGSVVAGLAYVLSGGDKDVAKPIFDASVRGDYVVTPEHLSGKRELEFVGRSQADANLRSSAPAPAADVSANKAASRGAGDSWE
jgi:hypothetical protein